MKKNKILMGFALSAFMFSCSPNETTTEYEKPESIHFIAVQTPEGDFAFEGMVNCKKTGYGCSKAGWNAARNTVIETYVKQDDIAGFFTNENWASFFPNLSQETVSWIISTNPKVVQTTNNTMIFCKNKNNPLDDANVLYVIENTDTNNN